MFRSADSQNLSLREVEFHARHTHGKYQAFLCHLACSADALLSAVFDARDRNHDAEDHAERHPLNAGRPQEHAQSAPPARTPHIRPSRPSEHALREVLGRFHAPQRRFQILFEVTHMAISPTVRVSFSRRMASDRCRWLFTVATGISI